MSLEQIELLCITNDKKVMADVLNCNDRHLKVAVVGTNLTILLHRTHPVYGRPYVGNVGSLEFRTLKEPPRV